MREAEKQGNGAVEGEHPLPTSGSMADHGRRIQHDAAALASEVRGTTADLERYLTDQVEKRRISPSGWRPALVTSSAAACARG